MKYQKKLETIRDNEPNTIRAAVAQDILDSEDGEMYLRDLLQHGCQSGMVPGPAYYHDTKEFYIEYIDEIDELREEMEESIGEPLKIGIPSYNWLAWFGYEETARKIADELSIEI